MSISLREQRLQPLEIREPTIFFPLGPSSLPPSMEVLEEEYSPDGVAVAGRRLRRSHTWSGYAGRLLLLDFSPLEGGQPLICGGQDPAEHETEEVALELESNKSASWGESDEEELQMTRTATESSRDGGRMSHRRSSGATSSSWYPSLAEDEEENVEHLASTSTTASNMSEVKRRLAGRGRKRGKSGKNAESSAPVQAEITIQEQQPALPEEAPIPQTTYMVQNLARNTTRHRFLEALNSLGFQGHYDFVHVPTSFRTGRNQGFAFVNFVTEGAAQRFASQFEPADGTRPTDKLWRVSLADVQGFEANSAAARSGKMARVRSNAHRPLVFH